MKVISWNMPLFKVWSEDKLNKKFLAAENFAELVSTLALTCLEDGGFDPLEALMGGAFDCLNWQHSGEFFKKVKCPGVCPGRGGWAVLVLTGT